MAGTRGPAAKSGLSAFDHRVGRRSLEHNAAEGVAGAGSAANVANGVRLGQQLSLESANSAFTGTGELSEGAIQNATQIFEPGTLSNPAIPEGFGKYTTETFASPPGPFQAHF